MTFERNDRVLYKNKVFIIEKYSLEDSSMVAITKPDSPVGTWVPKSEVKKLTLQDDPEYFL